MMAIIAEGDRQRVYLPPTEAMEAIAQEAEPAWKPDVPSRGTWASNAQGRRYGFHTFGDYFTPRQLLALTTFSDLLEKVRKSVMRCALSAGFSDDGKGLSAGGTGANAYADAVGVYLGCGLSRASDYWNSNATWEPGGGFVAHAFTRLRTKTKGSQ